MAAMTAVFLVSAGVLAVAIWVRGLRGIRLRRVAVLAAVLSASMTVATGDWSWQLWLGAAGCALAAASTCLRRRRPTRWTAVVLTASTSLSVGLVLLAVAALVALPVLRLLPPSGPAAVGTLVVELVDASRAEEATPDPDDRRFVVAQVWYPAAPGAGGRAWYLGRDQEEAETVAAALARVFAVPSFLLDEAARARTAVSPEANPLASVERFPVVLFSPGLTGVRGQNTGWAMDLASHGYVVVAVDHPYDAAAVVRRDGTVARTRVIATGDDVEDNRMADRLASLRAADLRFVLDELHQLTGLGDHGEQRSAGSDGLMRLQGRLDLQRVAVAGHSIGGAAALLAAGEDSRIKAVVDLDGLPRRIASLERRPPVLALVAGRGTGSAPGDERYDAALDEVLTAAAPPSVRVEVPGAAHLSFTDAPAFLPPLPALVGDGGRTSGSRAAAVATRAFLDAVLATEGARPSAPLQDRLERIGVVTVHGSQ